MTAIPSHETPEPIRSAMTDLWKAPLGNEKAAFASGRFRLLGHHCAAIYPEIEGLRLPKRPGTASEHQRLSGALEQFFRWIGAPWYGTDCRGAASAAHLLHQAFLMREVQLSHFMVLENLGIHTAGGLSSVEAVDFGPCAVRRLGRTELARYIPVAALARFGERHSFSPELGKGFYWLIARSTQEAGPFWRRDFASFFDFNDIGKFRLYDTARPVEVENVLFVLLLSLATPPENQPWAPFDIPWVYTLTNDLFANPPRSPEPGKLLWEIDGDEEDQTEIPARHQSFDVNPAEFQAKLQRRWELLQAAQQGVDGGHGNFHPLTRHFYVKALFEEGIDEIIANLSCVEATLMVPQERGRTNIKLRMQRLGLDEKAIEWLNKAYDLRNKYLHSLGSTADTLSWQSLAETRDVVTKIVDAYLEQTATHRELSRQELLAGLLSR
jgi:hypothetical protein